MGGIWFCSLVRLCSKGCAGVYFRLCSMSRGYDGVYFKVGNLMFDGIQNLTDTEINDALLYMTTMFCTVVSRTGKIAVK